MKRCREAAAGWMSRPKWRTFSLEKGPLLRGNESSNHQFSGDIIYLVGFQRGSSTPNFSLLVGKGVWGRVGVQVL